MTPGVIAAHQAADRQEQEKEMHDDAFTRGRSLTEDSSTGSPRSPQPDGSWHTPGPWTANLEGAYGNHAGGFSVETTIDGVGLFVICGRAGVPTRADESHANARLIAAAPELLDLLKRLRGWDHLATAADGPYWTRALDTAIAKAEGR